MATPTQGIEFFHCPESYPQLRHWGSRWAGVGAQDGRMSGDAARSWGSGDAGLVPARENGYSAGPEEGAGARTVTLVSAHVGVQEQVARVVVAAGLQLHTVSELQDVRAEVGGGSGGPVVLVGADVAVAGWGAAGRSASGWSGEGWPGSGWSGARRQWRDGVVVIAVGVAEHMSELWPVGEALQAYHVVLMPDGARWLLELLTSAQTQREGRGVGVMGASGGVGASVLACALGLELAARGSDAVVIDGDPIGGSIEAILGTEDRRGAGWADLQQVEGELAPGALREALPRVGGMGYLGWGALPESASGDRISASRGSMPAVMDAARQSAEICVIDIGRWAVAEWSLLPWCDEVLLAVRPDVAGLVAARNTIAYLSPLPVRLVLTGRMPDGFSERDLEHEFGCQVAGLFVRSRRVGRAAGSGRLVAEMRSRLLRRGLGRIVEGLGVER